MLESSNFQGFIFRPYTLLESVLSQFKGPLLFWLSDSYKKWLLIYLGKQVYRSILFLLRATFYKNPTTMIPLKSEGPSKCPKTFSKSVYGLNINPWKFELSNLNTFENIGIFVKVQLLEIENYSNRVHFQLIINHN